MSNDDDNLNGEAKGYYHRLSTLETRFDTVEERLVDSIMMLSSSITRLSDKVDQVKRTFETAIPIKIFFLVFALVFFLVAGIEGLKWIIRFAP